MYINFEFEFKFGQYCDSDQMFKLKHFIENEQYVIDESLFDEDEMNTDELLSRSDLLEDFGRDVLEQVNYTC